MNEIIEAIFTEKRNVFLTPNQFYMWAIDYGIHIPIGMNRCYLFGKPVINKGDYIVIIAECPWCKLDDGLLDKRDNCGHCGGYLDA